MDDRTLLRERRREPTAPGHCQHVGNSVSAVGTPHESRPRGGERHGAARATGVGTVISVPELRMQAQGLCPAPRASSRSPPFLGHLCHLLTAAPLRGLWFRWLPPSRSSFCIIIMYFRALVCCPAASEPEGSLTCRRAGLDKCHGMESAPLSLAALQTGQARDRFVCSEGTNELSSGRGASAAALWSPHRHGEGRRLPGRRQGPCSGPCSHPLSAQPCLMAHGDSMPCAWSALSLPHLSCPLLRLCPSAVVVSPAAVQDPEEPGSVPDTAGPRSYS